MPLQFNHTCPYIDSSIDKFKQELYNYLDSILDDACPLFKGEEKVKFINQNVESIYSEFEDCFEDTRTTNMNMRKEADRVIDEQDSKIGELEAEIKELQEKIDDLEHKNEELEDEISQLTTH